MPIAMVDACQALRMAVPPAGHRIRRGRESTSHNGVLPPREALGDTPRVMRAFAFRAAATLAEAARSQPPPSKPRLTRCFICRSFFSCPAKNSGQPPIPQRSLPRATRGRFGETGGGSLHSHAAGTECHASPGRADPDEMLEAGLLRLRSEKQRGTFAQDVRSRSGPCLGMWENRERRISLFCLENLRPGWKAADNSSTAGWRQRQS